MIDIRKLVTHNRLATYIIIFLLFFLQFVWFPFGRSYFEVPKVFVVEIGVLLLFLIQLFSKNLFEKYVLVIPSEVKLSRGISFHSDARWYEISPLRLRFGRDDNFLIFQTGSKNGLLIKNHNIGSFIACLILFLLTIYDLIFHQSATLLPGNEFRMQGTFLLWCLILFAFLSVTIKLDRYYNRIVFFALIFIQFVCSILFVGVGADRPIGTIGEPNALAADMIFLWPFLFFPKPSKKWEKILAGVGLLFAITTIFISASRSGFIALAIQLVFLGGIYLFRRGVLLSLIVSLLLLLASYVTPFIGQHDLYENRSEIWVSAMHAGLKQPILGFGFGNAEYALHASNLELHNHLVGYYVDSAHNIFLDWFVEGGIVGFIILIYFLFTIFRTFVIHKQLRNIVLLLGLITALSFNPASIVTLIAFWWLIGQGSLHKSV